MLRRPNRITFGAKTRVDRAGSELKGSHGTCPQLPKCRSACTSVAANPQAFSSPLCRPFQRLPAILALTVTSSCVDSLPPTSVYNDHNRIRSQALFTPSKYIYLHNPSIRANGYGAGPTFTPRTNPKSSRSRRADRCARGRGFHDRRPLPPLRSIRRVPRGRCRRRTSNRGGRE